MTDHITIDICCTWACNFRCEYCYQHREQGKSHSMPKEVALASVEYIKHIKASFPEKEVILNFFGGEPLLAVDVITRFVRRLGALVKYVVITNGSLLHKHAEYLRRLADTCGAQIAVTVSYDYWLQASRQAGSSALVRKNILLAHGLGLCSKTISVFQYKDLLHFDSVVRDFLELRHCIPELKLVFNLDRRGSGGAEISREQLIAAIGRAKALLPGGISDGIIQYNTDEGGKAGCISGSFFAGISPDGDIYPIGNIAYEEESTRTLFCLGNVRAPFQKLDERRQAFTAWMNSIRRPDACGHCRTPCRFPAWHYMEHGGATRIVPDETLCLVQGILAEHLPASAKENA